jgi:prepilin-type N-terminal cleavage/methylation domain-containing protein
MSAGRAGFTLLEAVVALAILVLVLTAALRLQGDVASGLARLERERARTELAAMLLERARLGDLGPGTVWTGLARDLPWRVEIRDWQAAPAGRAGGDALPLGLQRIVATVGTGRDVVELAVLQTQAATR